MWRERALNGQLSFDHPDVEICLAALGEFFKQGQSDLLPDDLRTLHDEALQELGQAEMPENDAPIRITSSAKEVRRLKPEDTENPRARFSLEVGLLGSQHLNRRRPWEAHEAARLLAKVEESRDSLGLEEASPGVEPSGRFDEPEWHAQQPMPKRAWAHLVDLYLQHLPDGTESGLSVESTERLLALTSDVDPLNSEPAGHGIPYTTRSEAASALISLRTHGYTNADFQAQIARLLVDVAPAVRRAVYFGARRLRGVDASAYALVLRSFAEKETDPHLLEFGTNHLFFPIPTDDEIQDWEQSCKSLLARVAGDALPQSEPNASERIVENVGLMAAHISIRVPSSATAISKLIAETALPETGSTLGWAFAKAAIVHIEDGYDPAGPLALLEELANKSARAASVAVAADASAARGEIELASAIATVLAATLTGRQPFRRWTLAHSDLSEGSERDKLKPEVRRVERDLWRIWCNHVSAWLSTDWCLYLQRTLLDSIILLRIAPHLDPATSEKTLLALRLDLRLSEVEPRIRDELARLIGTLLSKAKDRDRLIELLHLLVNLGHEESRLLAKRVAQEVREI